MVGIYKGMRDLIRKLLREQIVNDRWGCDLFLNQNDFEFCKTAVSRLKQKNSKERGQVFNILEMLKNDIFESYQDLSGKIKSYSENDEFFSRNDEQVEKLIDTVGKSCKSSIPYIKEFKEKQSSKSLFVRDKEIDGIVEKEYDEINKLNSNYTALAYLLTKYRENKSEEYKANFGFDLIFKDYFIGNENSFDASPFYIFVRKHLEGTLDETEKDILDNIYKTIQKTTSFGDKAELEYQDFLSGIQVEFESFIGNFSWVDMMGVDLIFKFRKDPKDRWYPMQIKSKLENCHGNYRFCLNFCVGKEENGDWYINEYDGDDFKESTKVK
jgi:hypothetical protein